MVFLVCELDAVELGDALDDVGDLGAEAAGDFGGGDGRVLDRVVEEAGGDGGGVHLHFGEDLADGEGMDDVGLAALALLVAVLL